MQQPLFNTVAILGVGLLGGSFGLALRARGLCRTIAGYSRTPGTLRKAADRGIIDTLAQDPAAACRGADLVLVAAPVGSFLGLIEQARGGLGTDAIVTDVGSVKGRLVSEMEAAMPEGVRFVGSHPIAGSDRSGVEYADAGLFDGARCIVTPTAKTDAAARDAVAGLWRRLGSEVVFLSPEEHDRIYCAVSHLPHLVAYAVMNAVFRIDPASLGFAGSGFRDLTRIAASSPELWTDISLMNRENLLAQITAFEQAVGEIKALLTRNDREGLLASLAQAQQLRETLGQH